VSNLGAYKPKYSEQSEHEISITFKGFLAVRLMEFDYAGKHYSYHGKKLENAVARLTADGGPVGATAGELVIYGQATHDWRMFPKRA
jgi:hypothetical protein